MQIKFFFQVFSVYDVGLASRILLNLDTLLSSHSMRCAWRCVDGL